MTRSKSIPGFAFREEPDGTITWGSTWEPGPYAGGEPVMVEYDQTKSGLWVPRQAWVRGSKGCIDMHDCNWIESRGKLYHHIAGGGDPYVHGWVEPERLPGRLWLAEGTAVTSASSPKRVLSDDDLLAIGIRRVRGPAPAPFEGAIEGEVFWCEVCKDYIPDEDDEGVTDCCCCTEQHHMHEGDLIVVADEDEAGVDESGVYRPTRWPFLTVGLIGGGYLHEDDIVRVADLPDDVRMNGYAAGSVCQDCAARVLADRGLPILGSEWSEDPEAMPDERREALLDAVRERVDAWIAGYPELRSTRVHEWFPSKMASRFGLPVHEMRMLCDEAGYSA